MTVLAACATSPHAAEPRDPDETPYRIVDGKVDAATYRGWQIYHSACHSCHGVDAIGTDVAPSLVERLRTLSEHDFAIKVRTSYRIVLDSAALQADDSTALREALAEEVMRKESGKLLMPAWQSDKKVQPRLTDLYAYLKARSDGALAPGKPHPAPERH